MTYQGIRKRKLIHVAFWYSIFTYLLIVFLQISGIRDFLTTIPLVHIAIVLVMLGVLDAFLHRSRTKASEENAVFIASAVFASLGLLDVLRYYIMPSFTSPIRLARVGLLCFFVVLSVSAVRSASQKHLANMEESVLRKLAYTDILTDLPNRTAFEEQKLYYMQKEPDTPLFLTVLDLNGLKTINDHYGHEEGDQAIIHIARDLIHAFPEKNTCFRIGGDEFCILSPDDETLFLQKLQKFCDNMQKTAEQLPYHYSAAYGYTLTKASLIDEAFHTADHNMYLRKTEMKATLKNF